MRIRHRLVAAAAVFALGLVACGDDGNELTGPNDSGFTAAEKQALTSALLNSGVLAGTPAGAYAALVVNLFDEVGTISASQSAAIDNAIREGISLAAAASAANSYEGAIGIQVGFDISGGQGWVSGVLGWNGLDTEAGTADQIVAVYSTGDDSDMPPATWDGTPGAASDVVAVYWDGESYYATGGSASVTASSFGGSSDCSVQTFTCSYSTGTMSGSFDFEASSISETTFTQVPITFSNLYAVKLMISN